MNSEEKPLKGLRCRPDWTPSITTLARNDRSLTASKARGSAEGLAACVPLAVAYTNPEDVRADLNACRPRDYAWLFRRTWGAFKDAEDGKVRGKDL